MGDLRWLRGRLITVEVLLLGLCWISGSCFSALPVGYEAYTEWEQWARMKVGPQTGLASSYDRSGGNDDYSHYESPEGLIKEAIVATVKTIDGPGIIYRFWMPHLTAKQAFGVRMYFDGESVPRIDTDSLELLGGDFGDPNYFAAPLVTTCAGGQVCYEPIPFAQSLRIETENKVLPETKWSSNRHYYQYSYVELPKNTDIVSYTGQLTAQDRQARSQVVAMFNNAGEHPAGDSPGAETVITAAGSIASGECLDLADLAGPGLVRSLYVNVPDANDVELSSLRLQVFYDGDTTAAIDVSVAHFFGAGRERALYRSLPLGTDSADGFYCYWPMPFAGSVLIRLCNEAGFSIDITSAKVEYELKAVDKYMCYLHAEEKSDVWPANGTRHLILSVTGQGHYVGEILYVEQGDYSFSMLEGDDLITVDGTRFLKGTGLEDTYNGGYYYNWVVAQSDEPEGTYPQSAIRPLHGILYVHREEGMARAEQYRWRIADSIPFRRSIKVEAETNYSKPGAQWTSVVFWYQLPCVLEDIDGDCDVDSDDFVGLISEWLELDCVDEPPCGGADLDGDKGVTLADVAFFGWYWLDDELL